MTAIERHPEIRISKNPTRNIIWLALGVASDRAEYIYAATNLGIYAPPYSWLVVIGHETVGIVGLYKNYRVFPFGDPALIAQGLNSIRTELPEDITVVASSNTAIVPDGYEIVGKPTIERRMYLKRENLKAPLIPHPDGTTIRVLNEQDIPQIAALLTPPPGGPDADTYTQSVYFDERRLKGSLPYFGAFGDQSLIGIVGTHGLAPDLGIAAIGDAFALPHQRNKGIATHLTYRLLQHLIQTHNLKAIGTDIREDKPGFRILEDLGFTQTQKIIYQKAHRTGSTGGD